VKEIKVSKRLKDLLFEILSNSPKLVISPITDGNESPSSSYGVWVWNVGYSSIEELEKIREEKDELDEICKIFWNNICNDTIDDGIYISHITVRLKDGVLSLEQHVKNEYPNPYKDDIFSTNHISTILKESLFPNNDLKLEAKLKLMVEFMDNGLRTELIWLDDWIKCGLYSVNAIELPNEVLSKLLSYHLYSKQSLVNLHPEHIRAEYEQSKELTSYEIVISNEYWKYSITSVTKYAILHI